MFLPRSATLQAREIQYNLPPQCPGWSGCLSWWSPCGGSASDSPPSASCSLSGFPPAWTTSQHNRLSAAVHSHLLLFTAIFCCSQPSSTLYESTVVRSGTNCRFVRGLSWTDVFSDTVLSRLGKARSLITFPSAPWVWQWWSRSVLWHCRIHPKKC